MKKTAYIVSLLVFIASSCKKPEDKYHVMPLAETVSDFFVTAKNGSYFVFQDTATGQTDTFRVSEFRERIAHFCYEKVNGKELVAKYFYYWYKTSLYNQRIIVTVQSDCDTPNVARVNFDFGAAMGTLNVGYNSGAEFVNGDEWQARVFKRYDSYTLWGGQTYNDVLYIGGELSSCWGFYSDFHYVLAKGIGLVGFRCYDHFWVLTDKCIVQ